ncbi:MAG: hypothetical protein HRU21_09735 [Pseudomonadales bacterium]|nr:hypothetical protein [Pseudomonadales bacterium]
MKFSIERHAYAPELNKIHFNNGGALKAPSIKSIKEARKKIFPKPMSGLYCIAESVYQDKKWQNLNKVVASGFCDTRLSAYKFTRQFKQKGGPLLSGEILPPNQIKLKFYYL